MFWPSKGKQFLAKVVQHCLQYCPGFTARPRYESHQNYRKRLFFSPDSSFSAVQILAECKMLRAFQKNNLGQLMGKGTQHPNFLFCFFTHSYGESNEETSVEDRLKTYWVITKLRHFLWHVCACICHLITLIAVFSTLRLRTLCAFSHGPPHFV